MTLLTPAIKIAQTVFKYRKYIYRTLVAQDRAISQAFKYGGYSKWTTRAVRHGALSGSVIGSLISNNAPDTPGNGISEPFRKQRSVPTSGKSYQTRRRWSTRCPPWSTSFKRTNQYSR